ncbi:MAG: DNA-binding protein, partial [Actinomycetota bacterium]|nr:DNA-binding protein [Actinomycetota bacterium]
VVVFIPEYVVGRWWEQLLHNQSALRLKGRLLFQPGVMVTNVPWQLESSARLKEDANARPAVGDLRRGRPRP